MPPARRPRWAREALAPLAVALLVLGALSLDAAVPTGADATDRGIHGRAQRAPAPSHEVYGYLPYWQVGTATATRIDYTAVSTIAFFAVPIRVDGALDQRSKGYRTYVGPRAAAITNAAHAQGVRVVPTFQLFDAGGGAALRRFLQHPTAQARFIREALALMARRGADGASLDVEPVPASLAAPFAAFVGRFGSAMHHRFHGSQLTVATPAIVSDQLLRGLAPVADRLFVMAYDYHWRGSSSAGAVAPLSGGPHNVSMSVANYLRLVPASKVILGVPYYGYSWPVVGSGSSWRVRPDAARWGGIRGVTYASVLDWLRHHPSVQVHHDPATGSWFRYWDPAKRTMREVHFEDASSAKAKFDYAIAQGLAGVGIWSLRSDAGETGMAAAIATTYVHPTRRVTATAGIGHVRLRGSTVRLDASITLGDAGTRAERGTLTWRVVGPGGRTVRSGRRLEVLYPGTRRVERLSVTLGRARALRAGTYRLIVRFDAGPGVGAGAAVRFRQRF